MSIKRIEESREVLEKFYKKEPNSFFLVFADCIRLNLIKAYPESFNLFRSDFKKASDLIEKYYGLYLLEMDTDTINYILDEFEQFILNNCSEIPETRLKYILSLYYDFVTLEYINTDSMDYMPYYEHEFNNTGFLNLFTAVEDGFYSSKDMDQFIYNYIINTELFLRLAIKL